MEPLRAFVALNHWSIPLMAASYDDLAVIKDDATVLDGSVTVADAYVTLM